MSRESQIDAEAETVRNVEGNMCGPVMRGADALPWSKTTSRTKGSRRNLGDLVWPAVAAAIPGRGRKARSRSCRGTGEESDEPRSTGEAPEQGRDERRRRVWREGGSVGGMADDEGCAGHRTGPSIHITAASLRIGAADQRPRSPDHARPSAGARCGVREEAGMSLPVKVWSVQSRASRTGASLAGVAATRGPKRRQRLDGVWH